MKMKATKALILRSCGGRACPCRSGTRRTPNIPADPLGCNSFSDSTPRSWHTSWPYSCRNHILLSNDTYRTPDRNTRYCLQVPVCSFDVLPDHSVHAFLLCSSHTTTCLISLAEPSSLADTSSPFPQNCSFAESPLFSCIPSPGKTVLRIALPAL